jgi:hypothetical protein
MTTKPPPSVKEFPAESLEKIAYNSVRSIPTQEPNDRNRLGYHVWQWLLNRNGTLENSITVSGSRMHISRKEALKIVTENLKKQGVKL